MFKDLSPWYYIKCQERKTRSVFGTIKDVIPPIPKHKVTRTSGIEQWESISDPNNKLPRMDAILPTDVCKPNPVDLYCVSDEKVKMISFFRKDNNSKVKFYL